VMARGNRREEIFLDEEDRRFFLKAVSEVCAQTGRRVHAWVIMSNHYHLFIETPEANHCRARYRSSAARDTHECIRPESSACAKLRLAWWHPR
jgi:REP element-mobilizing transposase RayT